MNLLGWNKYFFLGIGGIGMSALARYFLYHNKSVVGYDKTATKLTSTLAEEGAIVGFQDSLQLINENEISSADTLIIVTPAVPQDSELYQAFAKGGYTLMKRSEVLGEISKSLKCIGVAGTHGKTTTSTLLAHLLHTAHIPQQSFLGGIANNFESNLILEKDAKWMVAEADEFDRSFLRLHPHIAIITNIDPDHLDIYGSEETMLQAYRDYAALVPQNGYLVLNKTVQDVLQIQHPNITTYSIQYKADATVNFIVPENGYFSFGIYHGEKEHRFHLSLPGIHNVENAVATFCVAKILGIPSDVIGQAFVSFKGVNRRFQYHINSDSLKMIDDYAHHPTEIDSLRDSLRLLYPAKKITAVFQPHLFSRTRDFMTGFAAALSGFDEVVLLDIYPAREKPIEGITSEVLLDKINCHKKMLVAKENLTKQITDWSPEVLVTIGAGDIDKEVIVIADNLKMLYNV